MVSGGLQFNTTPTQNKYWKEIPLLKKIEEALIYIATWQMISSILYHLCLWLERKYISSFLIDFCVCLDISDVILWTTYSWFPPKKCRTDWCHAPTHFKNCRFPISHNLFYPLGHKITWFMHRNVRQTLMF